MHGMKMINDRRRGRDSLKVRSRTRVDMIARATKNLHSAHVLLDYE